MHAAVPVASDSPHSSSTRGKICTVIGWREVLLGVYTASMSLAGWMLPTFFLGFKSCSLTSSFHWSSLPLFFDGHHSHISLELIRVAWEHNVKLFCLPPNCTHIVQPLDVGVFGPAKKVWRKVQKKWKLETRGSNVSKEAFPGLISQLWEEALTPVHCKNEFRSSGIFPLSRDHVLSKLAPSTIFRSGHDGESARDEDIHHVTCDGCGHQISVSPFIGTKMRHYFRGVLEVAKQPSRTRCKTKVRIEGEIITKL